MLIFAHRGAAGTRRDRNTLDAFRIALRAGVQLETDARVSVDGRAVLVHDEIVRRGLTWHRVARRTAAQLGAAGIVTIDDLYRDAGTAFELSVDLKVPEVGPLLVQAAERNGAARQLWLVSDDLGVLIALRASSAKVRLVHESRAGRFGDARDHSDRLSAAAIDAQNTALHGWTAESVAYSHASNVFAFGSLVNTRAGFELGGTLGLDAVYTDRLELAGAVA